MALATTWMNLEDDIMLREISPNPKDKDCASLLPGGAGPSHPWRRRGERWVPGAAGKGVGS